MPEAFDVSALPEDAGQATLAGRVMLAEGPVPVIVREGRVHDVSTVAATTADLFDLPDPASAAGKYLCDVTDLDRKSVV